MHPHEKPSLQRRIAVARMSGNVIRATHGKKQKAAPGMAPLFAGWR